MKRLIAVLLIIFALPAQAAEWTTYVNARFGYTIDVPPGFAGQGEADNGDGQAFAAPTAELRVYSGWVMADDFEAEVASRRDGADAEGWGITYQVSTPHAASYSAKRGSRILYVRMISLCDGAAFGAFEIDYSVTDLKAFDAVVSRMVRGFGPADGAC